MNQLFVFEHWKTSKNDNIAKNRLRKRQLCYRFAISDLSLCPVINKSFGFIVNINRHRKNLKLSVQCALSHIAKRTGSAHHLKQFYHSSNCFQRRLLCPSALTYHSCGVAEALQTRVRRAWIHTKIASCNSSPTEVSQLQIQSTSS